METLAQVVGGTGYILFFAIGFAEFIGFPMAGGAGLVLAGALASHGKLDPALAALGAAAGALLGDAIWYAAARGVGPGLVRITARLSRDPASFEAGVRAAMERIGPSYLLPAKFVPGVGTIATLAAAYGGVGARRFLLVDGLAMLLWAGVYVFAGWFLAGTVERILDRTGTFGPTVLLAAMAGAAVVLTVRALRARRA